MSGCCCWPPPKWCGVFAFLGNFATPKIVLIKDWRLGGLLWGLKILIAIYIVFDLFTKQAYLELLTPTGTITPLNSNNSGDPLFIKLGKELSPDTHPYCFDQSRYSFEWGGGVYKDFECIWATPASIASKGETETFFTTYMTLDKTFLVKPLSDGSCPRPGTGQVPEGSEELAQTTDVCVYEKLEHIFPVEPEFTSMSFLHSYSTLYLKGSNPKTYIRNPNYEDGGKIEITKGNAVDRNLTTWLKVAGIDLDATLDKQPYKGELNPIFKGNNNTSYPNVRLSGIVIDVTLNYYQRKLAPEPYKSTLKGKSDSVVCIIDLEPKLRWSLKGADVRYMITNAEGPIFMHPNGTTQGAPGEVVASEVNFKRQGLQFRFSVGGQIGRFSTRALVTALVTYSVMLSIAQTITTFTALYGLGISSALYKEFILETVLWRKEYARFAAQALVAGYAFMRYDKDASFKLSRKEIFNQLKIYFGGDLSEDKVAAMADFLMRHGEDDEDDEENTKYSTINVFEWIEIFTEGKVSVKSLERLIDQEYKDPKVREGLVRLAMQPSKMAAPLESASATTPLLAGGSAGDDYGAGGGGYGAGGGGYGAGGTDESKGDVSSYPVT
ncbi:unnamed protein product [Ostreobium quekettii]|uniref:Uncharacterized protein n=1 Tax=Ostreobium quekettii TaxID=121088 RepID=A0A8S1IY51_9CHLO|nr:unnamed protein product [Ostreobium quekettii]